MHTEPRFGKTNLIHWRVIKLRLGTWPLTLHLHKLTNSGTLYHAMDNQTNK